MNLAVTPWQAHVAEWGGCTRCELHQRRTQVVLARGTLPADVLFVGEAPGRSEDALGKPFVGPAGKLLDEIVAEAFGVWPAIRLAFGNLIACIPLAEDDVDKLDEPPHDSVVACSPRLVELIDLANPRLLVRVGKHAQHYLSPGYRHSIRPKREVTMVDVIHPAAILRKPRSFQHVERQRAVVILRNAAAEIFDA